ncbi:MAG: hypothetical protein ACLPTZ_08170, partial [Beijerinckiaceae bacterium]
ASGRDRIALDFRSSTSAAPRIRPPTYESQPIHPNQEVSRRTLGNAFAKTWADNMEPIQQSKKVLILTATDVEDKMLWRELSSSGFKVVEPWRLGSTISKVFASDIGM